MYIADLYKKGKGTIQKFGSFPTLHSVQQELEKYCVEHNVHVVAKETCGDSTWNYLSDGTEFDYCIE